MEHYFFYSILGTGVSWLLYHYLLRKEKSFVFNRFYLLGSLMLCLAAPLLEIDLGNTEPPLPEVDFFELEVMSMTQPNGEVESFAYSAERKQSLLPIFVFSIYALITFAFLLRFSRNLIKILKKIRKTEGMKIDGLVILPVEEKANPFSFFHYLFLHKKDVENRNFSEAIFKHEAAHSKQMHSADVLLIEILSCFFWLNPFVWLYKKAVIRNHEYLADSAVLQAGIDKESYSYELIKAGDKNDYFRLLSGFNFIQMKNRLAMIHRERSTKTKSTVKISTALLMFALVFLFSSFAKTPNFEPLNKSLNVPFNEEVAPGADGRARDNISTKDSQKEEDVLPSELEFIPFAIVEQTPLFPGCESAESSSERKQCTSENISRIVQQNMSEQAVELYTLPEKHNVFVQFRIDGSGQVTGARARATSPQLSAEEKAFLEEEAVKAVNAIPVLQPARHAGEVVGVLYAVRL